MVGQIANHASERRRSSNVPSSACDLTALAVDLVDTLGHINIVNRVWVSALDGLTHRLSSLELANLDCNFTGQSLGLASELWQALANARFLIKFVCAISVIHRDQRSWFITFDWYTIWCGALEESLLVVHRASQLSSFTLILGSALSNTRL
jgi:hypothetical protein